MNRARSDPTGSFAPDFPESEESKRETLMGKPTDKQRKWLADLGAMSGGA
jgi:hypothetical protein